ncbi:hypothetical protein ACFJIW_14785 [Tahibacter sp. UC22_41]
MSNLIVQLPLAGIVPPESVPVPAAVFSATGPQVEFRFGEAAKA